jgi:erythronate-4-phosphate dehydrogenase
MFVCAFWIVELADYFLEMEKIPNHLHQLGIYPQTFKGLIGIITSPFIHKDFSHLFANTMPFLILGSALFYCYRGISFRIFALLWLFSGFLTWILGRPSFHIGASGVVYALFAFLFISGLIRRSRELIAISLLTVFLYGGMLWGFVPQFAAENVSYEAHGGGLVAGVALAFIYRNKGPQRKQYQWNEDDDAQLDFKQKLKIVIDKDIPFIRGVFEPYANVLYIEGNQIAATDVYDADALIIRTRTKCNRKLLENSTVRYIATATIGFDHIDTEYCKQNNIRWSNAAGCNSGSVMQYMASALAYLALEKNMDLTSKTIGIIGVGNVGKKVAMLADVFGMKKLLYDPPRALIEGNDGFSSLENIEENADIITFHVPLQQGSFNDTFHFADDFFFNKLQKKPYIINTSRGEVVDTNALKKALDDGVVSGFILDVFENEPIVDNPLIEQSILSTPHIAGYSADGKANCTQHAIQSIASFFDLPLKDWHIPFIPSPEFPDIFPNNYTGNMLFYYCLLTSYNIATDDAKLRNHPAKFEHFRNHYPIRREYSSFTIHGKLFPKEIEEKLKLLKFQINC